MNRSTENRGNERKGFQLSRRTLLQSSALLGGSALWAIYMDRLSDLARAREDNLTQDYELARPENILYTACLQCQIRCALKVKVQDGVVVKLDGSPYSAKQFYPNLSYDTPPVQAAPIDGKLCPRGQAGVQTHYDPYRLLKVLKRVGPRGSGQWQTIEFRQAIREIVNGGDLFGEGPVPGFKDIYALRDPNVAKQMAADVDLLRKGQMTVEEFKIKHAANLNVLIDPDHPDLGPKNNRFVFMPGRINRTRSDFAKRFVHGGLGSVNFFPHTSICELSIFVATKEMTRGPAHFKPDHINSEFIIFWGTGFAEANFGVTPMAELVTRGLVSGNLKIAVIDPRLSKSAAKAWKWVPVKPGGDLALALGMIRWIIENNRYDARYLETPNLDAAKRKGETSHTDATWLVRTDTMTYLRTQEAGLAGPEGFVVMTASGPARHDQAEAGLLEVDTTVNGIPVKSVFTLIKLAASEKTLAELADEAGVSEQDIITLATEFTSHGKKVGIDAYRGPAKHPYGFYTIQAINTLCALVGSFNWKGGMSPGGGSRDDLGGKPGQPYPIAKLHPNKMTHFGVNVSREGLKYEESTLFGRDGYPAKRPWYPFAFEMFHDVIPAAGAGYPYPIDILWIHMGTPAYSVPGGGEQIKVLKDPKKIPLVIATDIVVGETSMYADYIFPDISYLEQWASPGDVPVPPVKSNPIRQPVAAPVTEIVSVFGEEMPLSMEAVMLAIAEEMGLPGFGPNGFGPGMDLKRPEDFYLKIVANLAFGDKADGSDAVPDASAEEIELFRQARRHLPPSVFDEVKWRRAVGDTLWPKVVYVLNRGGRFNSVASAYDGERLASRFEGTFYLFAERVSKTRDSITGTRWDGLPRLKPPTHSDGTPIVQDDYPFILVTYKEILATQSRTIGNYWIQWDILPENFVVLNPADAQSLGLTEGDRVRLLSPTLPDGLLDLGNGQRKPLEAKVKLSHGVRPGTVVVSHHYGHWAYGASGFEVDGVSVPGDSRRAGGVTPNPLLLLDRYMRTAPITDPVGGSAVFFQTKVKLVKV